MSESPYSISLTVYKLNDFYYAVYSPGIVNNPRGAVFSIYTTCPVKEGMRALASLQENARQRAASKKIEKVHGL